MFASSDVRILFPARSCSLCIGACYKVLRYSQAFSASKVAAGSSESHPSCEDSTSCNDKSRVPANLQRPARQETSKLSHLIGSQHRKGVGHQRSGAQPCNSSKHLTSCATLNDELHARILHSSFARQSGQLVKLWDSCNPDLCAKLP